MAVRLLFRYPDHAFLLAPLSELAREELAHFEAVLRLLESARDPVSAGSGRAPMRAGCAP